MAVPGSPKTRAWTALRTEGASFRSSQRTLPVPLGTFHLLDASLQPNESVPTIMACRLQFGVTGAQPPASPRSGTHGL